MAKHRKTRKEKLRSENRKEHVLVASSQAVSPVQENRSFSFTFSADDKTSPVTASSKNHQAPNEYAFVRHDLIKTSAVVGGIVVAELLLFVTMR